MSLGKEYVYFFKDLAANNNADWFKANKKRYETAVKEPFNNLVAEVITLMKKIDPSIAIEPKDCIFRINRDIRFSADKSPYKNHMAAVVSKKGRKDMMYPGLYFAIEANQVMIAGGCYSPQKAELEKIRKAIAKDPNSVNKILNSKKFKSLYGELGGEKYKVLPAPYKAASEKAPALYQKSFHYEKIYTGATFVTRKDLAKFLVDHYKAAEEWNGFLKKALGYA